MEKFIYILIFILPAYLLRFEFFGMSTNAFEVLVGVLLVMFFVKREMLKQDLGEVFSRHKKIVWATAAILSGLILSMIVGGNYAKGLGIIKGWFFLPIGFSFLAAMMADVELKIQNMYRAYFYSGAAVAAVALGYFVLGKLTFDGRLEAFFNSPNYLAMYLAPALIIGCFMFKSGKTSRNNNQALDAGLFLLMGVVFYLTYSYTAWIAAVAGIFMAEVFLAKNRKANLKNILITGLVFLAIISSQWQNKKWQDMISFDERSSLASRVMIWRAAEKMTEDNWLWGIGPGNFQAKYLEYQKYFPPYLEWSAPHPHNLFLAFWLYGGAIGLVGFGALILGWLRKMLRIPTKNPSHFIALGIMFYVLTHGLADTTYFKNDLAVVFWLNLFLGLRLSRRAND